MQPKSTSKNNNYNSSEQKGKQVPRVKNFHSEKKLEGRYKHKMKYKKWVTITVTVILVEIIKNGGSHRSNDDDNDAFDRRGSGTTTTQATPSVNVQEITQIWHKTIKHPPKM